MVVLDTHTHTFSLADFWYSSDYHEFRPTQISITVHIALHIDMLLALLFVPFGSLNLIIETIVCSFAARHNK